MSIYANKDTLLFVSDNDILTSYNNYIKEANLKLMQEDKNIYKEVPSSKIQPVKKSVESISTQDFHTFNEKFWKEQSVELHKCYKQGHSYANNTNKKDTVDILKDLNNLIQSQLRESVDTPDQINLLFEIIKNTLLLAQKQKPNADKNCILSIIQGFTIGCLKFYDRETKDRKI